MAANGVCLQVTEPVRGLGNFAPSLWGDRFISSTPNKSVVEAYEEDINLLKEHVRQMLVDDAMAAVEKVNLINDVHRLGLSYHFEAEIDSQLERIFTKLKPEDVKEYDLYNMSIQFRIFREFGYKLPCDVFEKFTDQTGKFLEILASNVKGMLSLYEASQLRIRGEDILDEAVAFATSHLRKLPSDVSPLLTKQVAQALRRPFRKGMPRLEAAYYISTYEEEETRNELLLKLAKLNFNKLQSLYQYELHVVSKWWKDMEFTTRVPHARSRIVESYFWINGVYFEPRYSAGRIANSKLVQLLTVIDDTFDAYGTLHELKLFTDAVNRWDESAMDMLPADVEGMDRWRYIYRTTLDFCKELDALATEEVRTCSLYRSKEGVQEIIREYYREAFWSATQTTPTYEEYMINSLITSGVHMMALNAIKGMGEAATKDIYDWLHTRPRICRGSETVVRLQDDIVTHEAEQKRGQLGSAVEYYMQQYSVSKSEAIEEIQKQIDNAWKDMNEDFLKPTAVPRDFLLVVFRLACSVDVIYRYNDGFTEAKPIQGYITKLFLNPMVI